MNILVSAAFMVEGGAKAILFQFLQHLQEHIGSDRYLILVHPEVALPEIKDVEYLRVDVRNKLTRYRYDHRIYAELMEEKNFEPDLVISLQNTGINCLKDKPQIISTTGADFYRHFGNF